jgi:hypothetical protein
MTLKPSKNQPSQRTTLYADPQPLSSNPQGKANFIINASGLSQRSPTILDTHEGSDHDEVGVTSEVQSPDQ